ncbi:hypothetical protein MKX03_028951 [Papaver bracteatum]|nr:hypothetical protein MKX03_028951 [Papaver bracteatum]
MRLRGVFAAIRAVGKGEVRVSSSYAKRYQTTEYGRNLDSYRTLLEAAMSNNWESAEDFIKKHPGTALHIAAGAAHSEFVLHLIKIMSVEALELKDSYDGNTALDLAVIAGLDEAVRAMVQKHRHLTRICNKKGLNPLLNAAIHVNKKHTGIIRFLCGVMKDEPMSFEGHPGAQLICSITHASLYGENVESRAFINICFFVAYNSFHSRKLKSNAVMELVELIFKEFSSMKGEDKFRFFFGSNFLKTAVKNGSIDIVRMCISIYPDQLWIPQERRNIFQIAVRNRQEKMFDYLYDHMNADEEILTTRIVESDGGNILHVAAKIAPPSRLNIYTSPVTQMQSELFWFKKVKKRVPRALRNMRNNDGETPQEVFTREHKDLLKKTEAYMIRTAESCLVVAALVATVAFAAAITLPGGTFSDDADVKGKPILLGKHSFLAFMVADALALFSSTTSILLFLSIYIGNHNEGNFELKLPRTLKRGLGSLILSVLSVVIAFSMAISIILKDKYIWAPYLIFAVAAFTFYVSLNCHLKLIFELDDIGKPFYWTTSRDHQPDASQNV